MSLNMFILDIQQVLSEKPIIEFSKGFFTCERPRLQHTALRDLMFKRQCSYPLDHGGPLDVGGSIKV